jgi:hypothetical protein
MGSICLWGVCIRDRLPTKAASIASPSATAGALSATAGPVRSAAEQLEERKLQQFRNPCPVLAAETGDGVEGFVPGRSDLNADF